MKKQQTIKIVISITSFVLLAIILRTTMGDYYASKVESATIDEAGTGISIITDTQPQTQPQTQPKTEPTSRIDVETTEEAEEETESITDENNWNGPVLNPNDGVVEGPSGKETYYNLDMTGVVSIMQDCGYSYEYWVREDGVKMYGDYVMCAANLNVYSRGSLVESSLGTAIVCDTGGFAESNPNQLDIAVTW